MGSKRCWQIAMGLGVMAALAGAARGQATGYWGLRGDPEHKPGATDAWTDQNGWLGKIYSFDKTHVCYGYRHPNSMTASYGQWSKQRLEWDPLPGILIPGQGIPARAKVEGAPHVNQASGGVTIDGFGYKILHVGKPGEARSDLQKTIIPRGQKGSTNKITVLAHFSAMGADHLLTYNYVWKEGTPPAGGTGTGGTGTGAGTGSAGTGGTGASGTGTGGTGAGGAGAGGTGTRGSGTGEPARVTQMTLQAGVRKVQAGQNVMVPVYLIQAAAANMNFNVAFDAGVVSSAGAAVKGNLLDKSLFEAKTSETGIVRVGFAQGKDLSGTGTVAQIPFKAVGKPGDKSALRLEVVKAATASASNASVAVIHGQILIVGPDGEVPGDADGDGVLTAGDALSALKMSVKLIPSKPNMDMDNDAQITSNDAMLILQKAVGK